MWPSTSLCSSHTRPRSFPASLRLGTYTQRLYFRSNDAFARRIKCFLPTHPLHRVPRLRRPNLLLEGRKSRHAEWRCAEVTFLPREKRDYEYSLVCVTEREKLFCRFGQWHSCMPGPDQLFGLAASSMRLHAFSCVTLARSRRNSHCQLPSRSASTHDMGMQGLTLLFRSVSFYAPEARAYEGEKLM